MKNFTYIFSILLVACAATPELATTIVQIDDKVFEVRNNNTRGHNIRDAVLANKMLSNAAKNLCHLVVIILLQLKILSSPLTRH
jgi:hypothetical protein